MKLIFQGFILIIFLIATQRVVINIIFFDKSNIESGVIYKIDCFEGDYEAPTTFGYYIVDRNNIKYKEVSDREEDFSVNDTVVFRKIYNNNSNTIRIIKK